MKFLEKSLSEPFVICLLQVIGIFFVYMLAVKLEDGQQLYKYRDRYYNNAN